MVQKNPAHVPVATEEGTSTPGQGTGLRSVGSSWFRCNRWRLRPWQPFERNGKACRRRFLLTLRVRLSRRPRSFDVTRLWIEFASHLDRRLADIEERAA